MQTILLLYFVFDELMRKKSISEKKNNSMEYIGKNRLKYPNQTNEFGSDLFLKNTKRFIDQLGEDSDVLVYDTNLLLFIIVSPA
jgi:hypothetical protein